MFNLTEISEYFSDKVEVEAKDIKYRQSDDCIVIYLDKGLIVEKASKGRISHKQIAFVQADIAAHFNKKCEFIFLENDSLRILESSLGAILKKESETFISLKLTYIEAGNVRAVVYITEDDKNLNTGIGNLLGEILSASSIVVDDISFITPELELPSKMVLLRQIKIHQPITKNQLVERLAAYPDIYDGWLKRILDQLRKDNFIIWQKSNITRDGCYALTSLGLNIVPSGKNYYSSDIERALAIAKRKW